MKPFVFVIYVYETVVGYLEPSYIMCIRKKMAAAKKVTVLYVILFTFHRIQQEG